MSEWWARDSADRRRPDEVVLHRPVVPEREIVIMPDQRVGVGRDLAVYVRERYEHAARLPHRASLSAESIGIEPVQRLTDRHELPRVARPWSAGHTGDRHGGCHHSIAPQAILPQRPRAGLRACE